MGNKSIYKVLVPVFIVCAVLAIFVLPAVSGSGKDETRTLISTESTSTTQAITINPESCLQGIIEEKYFDEFRRVGVIYKVNLNSACKWTSLSNKEKQRVADYYIAECTKRAEQAGYIRYLYSIEGYESNGTIAFDEKKIYVFGTAIN